MQVYTAADGYEYTILKYYNVMKYIMTRVGTDYNIIWT